MNTNITYIEKILLNAIPVKQTILFEDWVLRLNDGYTYRANCLCPFHYQETKNVTAIIQNSEKLFQRVQIPPVVKVTPHLQIDLDKRLIDMNYEMIKTVYVMICPLGIHSFQKSDFIETQKFPSQEWLNSSALLSGISGDKLKNIHIQGARNLAVDSVFVCAKDHEKIIGCGYGTLENGYVGIYNLHVQEEYRRKGIATEIINAILQYGQSCGANQGYLVVNSKNKNALSLYQHRGFEKIYEYYFFQKKCTPFKIVDA
jgi:ribosomal protein S18 acetylase RimI-like enzyme